MRPAGATGYLRSRPGQRTRLSASPELKLAYNGKGQVEASTDPDGNVTKYKYNETTHDLIKIEPPAPLRGRRRRRVPWALR